MPIDYNSKDASNAWPKNDYHAVLKSVEDAISKSSGQPMQVWTIEVYSPGGKTKLIKEYVTAAAPFKLKSLAIALGKQADFTRNTFQADDHIGANFTVSLDIEDSDQFGEQNKIKSYKAWAGTKPPTPKPASQRLPPAREPVPAGPEVLDEEKPFDDSSIPF